MWSKLTLFTTAPNTLIIHCPIFHPPSYVKSVYINDIDNIAPCYLYEEYDCSIPYPRDDGITKPGKCKVKVKFVPYAGRSRTVGKNAQKDDSESLPGLKVLYSQEVSIFSSPFCC